MAPAVRKAIEKVKASARYLPKYSPDLNPIELPYSKFKRYLRKIAARTIQRLTRAIRLFISQTPPERIRQRFRSCGLYFKMAGIRYLVIIRRSEAEGNGGSRLTAGSRHQGR
jgi:hypothetical protein